MRAQATAVQRTVATVYHRPDARLIAAAPDLLQACEAALTDWHSHPRNFERKEPPYLAELRAVIAKARGA